MAFGSFDDHHSAPMSEINTTPLVDVMLVLLVIFIITAPLLRQAIPVDLPDAKAERLNETPVTVRLALYADGHYRLDDRPVDRAEVETRFRGLAGRDPELHLYVDRATRYEHVADILAAARAAGIVRIAFVTQPTK